MGNPISKVRAEVEKPDGKAEQLQNNMQERLNILEKMLHSHLKNELSNLLNGRRGDQEIHTGTVVELQKKAYITESEKESQDLKDAIGDFFHGNIIDGLEHIVQLGAEAILGNNTMGEFETSDMIIIWNSNALLRCDVYYYRWNFSSKDVIDKYEGVMGVLLVKRVIDMTKTDPQVLTWAITEQANRDPNPKPGEAEKEIDHATAILEKVVGFQVKLRQLEVERPIPDEKQ